MKWRHKLNLLVAYPYASKEMISLIQRRSSEIRFVLDSGAFTAWKAGKPIQLDDYCRFIESLPFKPWRYFSLDVIGDPHATLKNYETMLSRGFNPVPIFTRGEDPSILNQYYETSDVVGIGGLVGTQKNSGFVRGIMKEVGDRKVHWLGFTNLPFLKYYKPYMADSSSWEMGARFAQVPLYIGGGNMFLKISKANIVKQLKDPKVRVAIERYGIRPDDLLNDERWQGGASISRLLGGRSYRSLSEDLTDKFGTNLFLAAATAYAVDILLGE